MVYMGKVGGQITRNIGYSRRRDVKIKATVRTTSNRRNDFVNCNVSNRLQKAILPKLLVGDVRKPLTQASAA